MGSPRVGNLGPSIATTVSRGTGTTEGAKANRTPAAWAPDLIPPRQRIGAESLRLHGDLSVDDIQRGLAVVRRVDGDRPLPAVDRGALSGLKFSAALPEVLARRHPGGP